MPIGIEASGYTLEVIDALDHDWIVEFRALLHRGACEFIGSGYAQIIGPLVPPAVNAANLRLGNKTYEKVLNTRPILALINEQAYSAGMIQHYLDAGYHAIMMEWDNPAQQHPEWDPEWRYFPQYACGKNDDVIPLIWNKSIAFQQFQRYAHGETCLEDYMKYLSKHVLGNSRVFPLYANDVEIFDFRPKRYATEAEYQNDGEWLRIVHLFESLRNDARFTLIPPSQALKSLSAPGAGHHLQLESAQQPIPVKKQGKYNVIRWGVTGRADSNINALCWRAYDVLKWHQDRREDDWKELCYLWSSDFRTHITTKRWNDYQARLNQFLEKLNVPSESAPTSRLRQSNSADIALPPSFVYFHDEERKRVTIENDQIALKLNCRRGLAVESLCFKGVSSEPLIMTLPHGFYDHISKGADFYSGHLVLEAPGQHKITDLGILSPKVEFAEDRKVLVVHGNISTPLGDIYKTVTIRDGEVKITYELDWKEMPLGSLRLGHVTVNPNVFSQNHLYFETHNGGVQPERFEMNGHAIDHGRNVSFLVSASQALGMTEGSVKISDQDQTISIQVEQGHGYLVGLMTYMPVGDSYFCRMSFSGAECDDTSLNRTRTSFPRYYEIKLSAKKATQPVLESQLLATTSAKV